MNLYRPPSEDRPIVTVFLGALACIGVIAFVCAVILGVILLADGFAQ